LIKITLEIHLELYEPNSSGKLYTISTAAAGLMGACLAYNLFSGNLVARKRED